MKREKKEGKRVLTFIKRPSTISLKWILRLLLKSCWPPLKSLVSAMHLADIETLLSLHSKNLDWTLIEEYFRLFDMDDYNRLREKYSENF